MQTQPLSRLRLAVMLIIVSTLLVVMAVVSDWQEMYRVVDEADWHILPWALLFTFFSYLCVSYGFSYVSRLLGIRMRKRDLAAICFVSTVVNHVITTGGVVGYSLRYLLMKMYNVSLKDTVAASILHFYLTSLDMLGALPLTLAYLLLNAHVPRGVAVLLGLMTLFFGIVFVIATGLVFVSRWREPVLMLLAWLGRIFLRRDIRPSLDQYDETLLQGARAMRHQPRLVVWIMFLTMVDFACSILALGFCFEALGPPVKAGVLITGFVIGVMAGVLSMVPGGFGVQEGSMAGVFVLLGVRLEQAVLASILFRVIYYLLPYILSLVLYARLLKRAEKQTLLET